MHTLGHLSWPYEWSCADSWANHRRMVGLGGGNAESLMEADCCQWCPFVVSQQRLVESSLCPDPQGGSLSSATPPWCFRSNMGAEMLDHCACPPKVDQLLSLCWTPSKCMWANACTKLWCDDSRLREELVECHIGSFVQVHIETVFCDLIRLDLQAALQRSIDTLHLPVKRLQDDHVMMKVFVPHGVTCYSGTSYTCITQFENWQSTLIESGKRAYRGRNPETMIFHRVHSAFAEVSSLFDPITNHFILSDSDEQEYTRTVVFAVFTSRYEFFGACHWTRVTKVWDILDLCGGNKGWVVYHNNQRLGHHKVSVHHGDVFACYERNNCNTPFQADRVEHDAAMERVANALAPEPSEAVEPLASELYSSDAVGDDSHVDTATFEQTGDPLLLIGRASGQHSQGDPADALHLSPFQ